jgi:hypothetical protein
MSEMLINFYQTIQHKKPLKMTIFLFERSVLHIHMPVMCLPQYFIIVTIVWNNSTLWILISKEYAKKLWFFVSVVPYLHTYHALSNKRSTQKIYCF